MFDWSNGLFCWWHLSLCPDFLGFCVRNVPFAGFLRVNDITCLSMHFSIGFAPWIGWLSWFGRHYRCLTCRVEVLIIEYRMVMVHIVGSKRRTHWPNNNQPNVLADSICYNLANSALINHRFWYLIGLTGYFVDGICRYTPNFLAFCVRNVPSAGFLRVSDMCKLSMHSSTNLAPWIGWLSWFGHHYRRPKDGKSRKKIVKKRVLPT